MCHSEFLQTLYPDDPYYSVYDDVTNSSKTFKLKGTEPVYVDYVAIDGKKPFQKVTETHLIHSRFKM